MSDVSKLGTLGEGEDSRPLKVDLTRIDIRRGTINLPRRFYDAFPAGDIEAADTVAGGKLTVSFNPPRELQGLAPFFEEHDLQPNDAVAIAVAGGLQLTPVKRERQQGAARDERSAARRLAPEAASQPPLGEVVREREPQGRVRQWEPDFERESGADERSGEREPTRVRLEARQPATYLAPPTPEIKGGWQDVLHDPAPRRGQMLRPSERAVVHPLQYRPEDTAGSQQRSVKAGTDQARAKQARTEQGRTEQGRTGQTSADQARIDRARTELVRAEQVKKQAQPDRSRPEATQPERGRGEAVQPDQRQPEAPRPERMKPQVQPNQMRSEPPRSEPARPQPVRQELVRPEQGRQEPARSEPARPDQGRPDHRRSDQQQQGLFGTSEGYGTVREALRPEAKAPALEPRPLARSQEPSRPAAPNRDSQEQQERREREPVLVGASAAAGDATARIAAYLQDPATPAIVRASAIAEQLGLPLDAVQTGLSEVSRNSGGSVAPIRTDVYLVKRHRQE